MNDEIALLAEIARKYEQRGWLIATAESCTGGLIAKWLTDQAGSSAYFDAGFITYSNAAKQAMLGVAVTSLERFGAVSQVVAEEMALGALDHSQAHTAVAVTGIAGPSGGSREKPVGTVWIAVASKSGKKQANLHQFSGDRQEIRQQTAINALKYLLQVID
ncbi:MAG: CinA family protein [Gammaproteobacteria bacterium]|nr:CinA family protein [Gammaproteobacteria bacterium]